MDAGFRDLVGECYRLARSIPWRPEQPTQRDWDDVKYLIMRNATLGMKVCELKYDAKVESELARIGFVVATREGDEKQKLCKALIVAW